VGSDLPATCPVSDDAVHAAAWRWFQEYLSRPHAELGREGHVCPFVESAIRGGTLRTEVRRLGSDVDDGTLVDLVTDMMRIFRETWWPHRNTTLHALAVMLPDLSESNCQLLDEVQVRMKPTVVREGFMLGQFHPRCPEPAARNPAFQVSRSPVPMLVLRRMAFHDVIFLDDDAELFDLYDRTFGHRYAVARNLDPLYVRTYRQAHARFRGASDRTSRERQEPT
jgi:hypothetical protein